MPIKVRNGHRRKTAQSRASISGRRRNGITVAPNLNSNFGKLVSLRPVLVGAFLGRISTPNLNTELNTF